ncbi:MAG: hypothetical protein CL596_04795 [Alteromonas sp.]|nr:hypothetical protein [Alteromonas sp.]MAY22709.1 hypothetical protein [Flavobacteriaceae bacterium]
MSEEQQLYGSLGYCAFMLLLAYLYKWNLPKKINWLYGYRTRRSMANETIWKAANQHSSSFMVKLCWYSFIIPIVCYFVFPTYNFMITLGGNTLLVTSTLWFTEKYLDKDFDKNGNPKN